MPAALFAPELVAAYPEAKVIILNRDPDKWYESVKSSIIASHKPGILDYITYYGDYGELGQWGEMVRQILSKFFGPQGATEENAKRVFHEYHDNLRRIVPKERLLEFSVKDGYGPLCEFLQLPVPMTTKDGKLVENPFPRVNESSNFQERHMVLQQLALRRTIRKWGLPLVFGIGAACIWGSSVGFWRQ